MFLIKNQNQMTNLPPVKYFYYIFSDRLSGVHLKTGPKPASGPSVTKLPGGGLSKKHPVGGFWRRARMQGWQRRGQPSGPARSRAEMKKGSRKGCLGVDPAGIEPATALHEVFHLLQWHHYQRRHFYSWLGVFEFHFK